MKSNWLKISVSMIAALVVALAITSGYAANNSKQPAKQLPKLLDLGADKCVPCRMMFPVLDQLKKDYKGQLDVQFIDVWKNQKAAGDYKIRSIPTQIFFDAKGKEIYRHVGFISEEDIVKAFKDHGVKLKEPAKPKK